MNDSSEKVIAPTTRLCFKNLPSDIDEHFLRQTIMTETVSSGPSSSLPLVQVTDVRILRNHLGKSRKIGFIGFKTIEQSRLAKSHWDKAFLKSHRLTVEFADPPGSSNLERPWSKYSKDSSKRDVEEIIRERTELSEAISSGKGKVFLSLKSRPRKPEITEESKQNRIHAKQKLALSRHPALIGLTAEQRQKVLEDPKFHDYMSLIVSRKSKTHKFWDNDDQSTEAKSLRALYLASEDSKDNAQNSMVDEKQATYEDLMKDLSTKKPKENSGDDSDDEYFDNPAMDMNNENENQYNSTTEERKEMRGVIDKILNTTTTAHKPISDADYFKQLQSSSFDSDSEDDFEIDGEEHPRKRQKIDSIDTNDADTNNENADLSSSSEEDENSNVKPMQVKKERQSDLVQNLSDKEAEVLILETSRLFLRNLPFSTTEAELDEAFGMYGTLSELTLPLDFQGQSRGFAYLTYSIAENALEARRNLHNTIFLGRLVQVLPGLAKKEDEKPEFDPSDPFANVGDDELRNMDYKTKKLLTDKAQAQTGHNWNTLFLNSTTVAAAISQKFDLDKRDLLGADDGLATDGKDNVAVRMAIAETHMISETKRFLEESGVNLAVFSQLANANTTTTSKLGAKTVPRSETVILFKNIPFETEVDDIKKECKKYGRTTRILLPPYKTLAIVEFASSREAKKAFVSLAYRKFLNVPLFLEWAPADCLRPAINQISHVSDIIEAPAIKTPIDYDVEDEDVARTIHVKNLAFNTTEDSLRAAASVLCEAAWKTYASELQKQGKSVPDDNDKARWRVRSVTIARRIAGPGSKYEGQKISMGYGFVEMSSGLAAVGIVHEAAQRRGYLLDNHTLEFNISKKRLAVEGTDASAAVKKKTSILAKKGLLKDEEKQHEQEEWSKRSSKLIVRNIPFEGTVRDIRELFAAFGQIKRVRLPKKAGSENQHRGFAFVDFVTANEARTAYNALQSTHLYGRHLVLEWAKPDETLEELREKAAASVN